MYAVTHALLPFSIPVLRRMSNTKGLQQFTVFMELELVLLFLELLF